MPTPQEQADLDKFLIEQQGIKNACFSYLDTLDREAPDKLKMYGYLNMTNAEAMQAAYRSYKKRLDALIQAHVRKYPDER